MLIHIDNLIFKATTTLLSDFFYTQPQNVKNNLLNLFFICAVSLFITKGSVLIIKKIRSHEKIKTTLQKRLGTSLLINTVFGALSTALVLAAWQKISIQKLSYNGFIGFCAVGILLASFITVLYESFYLNKELELDKKVFKQLENERIDTEMNVLKNELNPHFIFNSLTSLSHLVNTNDQQKAQLFIQKLSQVYKYFLINKDKELITLDEELQFLNDYFYLLKIRFDNMVRLKVHYSDAFASAMILPCALQILVENAIKHNMFTEEKPLEINIGINKTFLVVSNNLKTKMYAVDSTKIGLRNLSTRYRLLTHRNIISCSIKGNFIVKLPLVKQPVAKLI